MKASEVKLAYQRKSTGIKISSSNEANRMFHDYWDSGSIDFFESFVVAYLSRRNEVLGIMKISEGSIEGCVVDIRKIFQGALLTNSSSLIVAHNHPSGNLKPSTPDINITKDIKEAGEFMKIKLLDHIIITSESYYSFMDEGML